MSPAKANGPSTYVRDENGLLNPKVVDYEFNKDGSVNWRAMISEEHLFPNRSWFEGRGKDTPRSIEGLGDHQLLIKLSGIKELARLRGFSDVSYEAVKCEQDHVAVICHMTFLPNYETNSKAVMFQDMANATLDNTSSFATKFLETIACNRAFVRCVRNFLNVHIVGDDEIDKSGKPAKTSTASPLSPHGMLEKQFESFDKFKSELRVFWKDSTYRNEDAASWVSFKDIPAKEARILLKLVKSI
jgi:hypothetical protein|tara:strand:- start:3305 stop:4036 length:732 start_codon:yes stop_codon:yes gene_type:complete